MLLEIASVIGGQQRVLDVGAHIGACALPLGMAGHEVVAIEANPQYTAQLNASVRLNGLTGPNSRGRRGSVKAINIALSSPEGAGVKVLWERET